MKAKIWNTRLGTRILQANGDAGTAFYRSAPSRVSLLSGSYSSNVREASRLAVAELTDLWPSLTLEEASRLMRGDYEIDGDTVIVKRTINKDIS